MHDSIPPILPFALQHPLHEDGYTLATWFTFRSHIKSCEFKLLRENAIHTQGLTCAAVLLKINSRLHAV